MSASVDTECVTTVPLGVGDAVGVENSKWFVAIVNNNSEKAVQERLDKLNYESYVAKQKTIRVWKNGRKSKIDKVLIPSLVFIKCTEAERRDIVTLPFINRFMMNRASSVSSNTSRRLAIIPQKEIDTLKFMLGQSDIPVSFVDTHFRVNDRVEVVRGSLKGLEGEVVSISGHKSVVIVRIDILGSARVEIDTVDIKHIQD